MRFCLRLFSLAFTVMADLKFHLETKQASRRTGDTTPETTGAEFPTQVEKDNPVRMLICVLAQEPGGGGDTGARGEAVLPTRWTSCQAQMQIRPQPSPDRHRQDAKAPQDWGSSVGHASWCDVRGDPAL